MGEATLDGIQDALDTVSARMDQVAEEAIRTLFHSFPVGQKITLANGKTGTTKVFFEPKQVEGQWCFGIDIKYDDGSGHLEYTIKQTGHGGVP